jgi:hypothetical protein
VIHANVNVYRSVLVLLVVLDLNIIQILACVNNASHLQKAAD